uniref:Uncharacterized protein n=1 Tax=Malurus cyaneus samueli TaxID=2593467 RepID=A0A8C5TM84_9PASS
WKKDLIHGCIRNLLNQNVFLPINAVIFLETIMQHHPHSSEHWIFFAWSKTAPKSHGVKKESSASSLTGIPSKKKASAPLQPTLPWSFLCMYPYIVTAQVYYTCLEHINTSAINVACLFDNRYNIFSALNKAKVIVDSIPIW